MAGYETLEVLHKVDDDSGKLPVGVAVEKQCRIRDDESKSRPFVKMQLTIGNRTIYCDPQQAGDLANLINDVLPKAQAAISQLQAEQEAEREAARQAWEEQQKRGNGQHRKGGRKTGATARKREKERRGERKSPEQRKAERSQRDREFRQKSQGRKG